VIEQGRIDDIFGIHPDFKEMHQSPDEKNRKKEEEIKI
jgi:hypothetical protein